MTWSEPDFLWPHLKYDSVMVYMLVCPQIHVETLILKVMLCGDGRLHLHGGVIRS